MNKEEQEIKSCIGNMMICYETHFGRIDEGKSISVTKEFKVGTFLLFTDFEIKNDPRTWIKKKYIIKALDIKNSSMLNLDIQDLQYSTIFHPINTLVKKWIFVEPTMTLKDKNFVITGPLSHERKFYEALIEIKGGHIQNSVTKNTDFLLTEITGTVKANKAKQLGIPILSEFNFGHLLFTGHCENSQGKITIKHGLMNKNV